ncbi:hypothetical protein ACFC1B_30960 [Streptomyces xiamenensis]|uniref:hypothetical protein n=1 Tax=Streptomyces TaxID=1883 RepID=UPI0004C52AB4|nr:hypothetical protein [Streptomyces sp. NRRL F-2890]
MTTDTGEPAGTPSLEAGAEFERTLDRLEARMVALQAAMRARRSARQFPLWLHDLRETRESWFLLVDPGGQDPTPERT